MDETQGIPIVVMEGMRHIFWLKSEGDSVREGESIASMEAGKGTTFIESPADGTLSKILIGTGGTTVSGEPIGYVKP
jgi:pyruvate dehydrogenase E2 component (dihydrolipoamide acetyltransferase)